MTGHVYRIPHAFIAVPFRPFLTFVLRISADDSSRVHNSPLTVRVYHIPLLTGSTPLIRCKGIAPIIGAPWFLHCGPMHLNWNLIVCWRVVSPTGRNRNDLGIMIKVFLEPVSGVVMHEHRGIPRAVEGSRTAMETLAAFVEQDVSTSQDDFMRV